MFFYCGRKTEHPEETYAQGEHANSTASQQDRTQKSCKLQSSFSTDCMQIITAPGNIRSFILCVLQYFFLKKTVQILDLHLTNDTCHMGRFY